MSENVTILHDECEHSGDIERDLGALRKAGISFTVEFEGVCNGPEVGVSIIKTSATVEQLNEAATKGGACIRHLGKGGSIDSARDFLRQEEAEHEYEYGDEEEWDD